MNERQRCYLRCLSIVSLLGVKRGRLSRVRWIAEPSHGNVPRVT